MDMVAIFKARCNKDNETVYTMLKSNAKDTIVCKGLVTIGMCGRVGYVLCRRIDRAVSVRISLQKQQIFFSYLQSNESTRGSRYLIGL